MRLPEDIERELQAIETDGTVHRLGVLRHLIGAHLADCEGQISAFQAVQRELTEAVEAGGGDPGGPYWEDAVRWLRRRAEGQHIAEECE